MSTQIRPLVIVIGRRPASVTTGELLRDLLRGEGVAIGRELVAR